MQLAYLLDELVDVIVPNLDGLVLAREGGRDLALVFFGVLFPEGLFQKVHGIINIEGWAAGII